MRKLRSCPHVNILRRIYVAVRSENRDYSAEFSCFYFNQYLLGYLRWMSKIQLPVCACWFIYTLFNVNKQSKWSSTLVEETYSRPVISKLPWCHTMPPSARWRNQPPGKWHVTYSMKQGHPWISLPPGAMLPSTVTQCVSSVTLNDCTFKVSNLRGCLYTLEILSVDVVYVTSDITWVGVDGFFLPY